MRIILISIVIFLSSCEEKSDNKENCYNDDPREELIWLNELIEGYSRSTAIIVPSIFEYSLNDSTYFTVEKGDEINKIYNCSGYITCSCDSINQPCLIDFEEKAVRIKKIWPE